MLMRQPKTETNWSLGNTTAGKCTICESKMGKKRHPENSSVRQGKTTHQNQDQRHTKRDKTAKPRHRLYQWAETTQARARQSQKAQLKVPHEART